MQTTTHDAVSKTAHKCQLVPKVHCTLGCNVSCKPPHSVARLHSAANVAPSSGSQSHRLQRLNSWSKTDREGSIRPPCALSKRHIDMWNGAWTCTIHRYMVIVRHVDIRTIRSHIASLSSVSQWGNQMINQRHLPGCLSHKRSLTMPNAGRTSKCTCCKRQALEEHLYSVQVTRNSLDATA